MLSGVEDKTVTQGNLLQVNAQFGSAASGNPLDKILDEDARLRRQTRATAANLVASLTEGISRQVESATSLGSEFGRHVTGKAAGPHAAMAAAIIGLAERTGLPEVDHVRRRLTPPGSSRFVAGRKLGGFDLN